MKDISMPMFPTDDFTKLALRNEAIDQAKAKAGKALELIRNQCQPYDYPVALFLLSLHSEGVELLIREEGSAPRQELISKTNAQSLISLKAVHKVFEPILERLDQRALERTQEILHQIPRGLLSEAPEVFDDLLSRVAVLQGRRTSGEHFQPIGLTQFALGVAQLDEGAEVYNPFAGWASFGVFLPSNISYFGQEIHEMTWAVGAMRTIAYKRAGTNRFSCADSIQQWNPEGKQYDLIVSNPPFGVKLEGHTSARFGQIHSPEAFLIDRALDDLKEGGKLVMFVPQTFLSRGSTTRAIRQFLVDRGMLEMVIAFPGGTLSNTAIPIAMLVIKNRQGSIGAVKFVDARRYVSGDAHKERTLNVYGLNSALLSATKQEFITVASAVEISENDYSLAPPLYLAPKLEPRPGHEIVALGMLISPVRTKRVEGGSFGRSVTISNLEDDGISFFLDLGKLESAPIPHNSFRCDESALLISMHGNNLFARYFKYEGESIYIRRPLLAAFSVDESRVDISYLAMELRSEYVKRQAELYSAGSLVRDISIDDLFRIKVQLPSLQEQRTLVHKALETWKEAKAKEIQHLVTIHGLENEVYSQNAFLRHTLAGRSTSLRNAIQNMRQILEEQVTSLLPNLMSLKLSPKHQLTLADYLNILERDSGKIVSVVSRQINAKADIENVPLAPVDVLQFLKRYCEEQRVGDKDYKILFSFDKEGFSDENGQVATVFTLANESLFKDLLDNLVENAVAHAFSVNDDNRIEIYLMYWSGEDRGEPEIRILVSNTGKPFPEDFKLQDYITKGRTAGGNEGNGFGGWYVHEIVKKFKGRLDLIDETGPEGLGDTDLATSFEISLPVINFTKYDDV